MSPADIDPAAVEIEPLLDEHGVFRHPVQRDLRPLQFRRYRQKRNDYGGRRPAGFYVLHFPCLIPGPVALGYSSHFGLGLFVPAAES